MQPLAAMLVDPSAFDKVPFLKHRGDERIINLASLWDGERWRMWMPYGNGLIEMQGGGETIEGGYFAKTAQRETDVYLQFSDFMWKHGSWKEIARWLFSVEQNIFRVAASLAKIDHFNEYMATLPERERTNYSSFISTEVEYLFSRCRTLFDELQQVIAALWSRVKLVDEAAQKQKKNLPADSFRKALERIKSSKPENGPPYGLPPSILAAYDSVSKFFYSMRDIRDQVMHRGGSVGTVFMVSNGTAVSKTSRLAGMTPQLRSEHDYNQNLVSLRPVIANLVFSTLQAFNEFVAAFASVIKFPESMMPEHRYFLRCPHMPALAAAHAVHRNDLARTA